MPCGTKLRLLVLSDGRAGHDAQSLGLAEALARRREAAITRHEIRLQSWAERLPPRVTDWLVRAGGLGPGQVLADSPGIDPDGIDLAIGAGRRVAPLLAMLRRAGVRSMQILDPGMSRHSFDALVIPEHDRVRGANVVTTVGAMGRLTADGIAAATGPWRERVSALPSPRVALLIGGPSGSADWQEADGARLAQVVAALAARGVSILATPSRRTPPALTERLRQALAGHGMVWDGTGSNPYPGILGLADAVIVTEDSVNMASEAASTGRPVHIFRLARVNPKLRRFHESLSRQGAARDYAGALEAWGYTPLAEADRVAALIERTCLDAPTVA